MSRWKDRRVRRLGPALAAGLIRCLGATLRVRVRDEAGFLGRTLPPAAIPVFWHNRLLMLPWFYRRLGIGAPLSVMISRSKDGALIADTAAKFGVGALRGSSSKGAAGVSRAALSELAAGRWVGVTPDGPRGPVYTLKPGLVSLARKAGVPVIPVTVHYGWKICAASWDRFQLPLPFSKTELVVGEPLDPDSIDFEARLVAALGR